MLKSGDTFERNGKTWRFVGVAEPKPLDYWIGERGNVVVGYTSSAPRPIVEEVIPEWITPTDEHAKARPECEVRDSDKGEWVERTLVSVQLCRGFYTFATVNDKGDVCTWKQCRIRNPELPR
jgi:hypothetical protein